MKTIHVFYAASHTATDSRLASPAPIRSEQPAAPRLLPRAHSPPLSAPPPSPASAKMNKLKGNFFNFLFFLSGCPWAFPTAERGLILGGGGVKEGAGSALSPPTASPSREAEQPQLLQGQSSTSLFCSSTPGRQISPPLSSVRHFGEVQQVVHAARRRNTLVGYFAGEGITVLLMLISPFQS